MSSLNQNIDTPTVIHDKVAVVMLLPECNMTCDYCVIEDNFNGFTYDNARILLHQLKKENYPNIILGGGEPTLWPGQVFDLAREAKELGFFVQIGTNSIRLPKDFAKLNTIDRWIIPLDSAHENIHNQLRHYKKSHYQIITETLSALKNEKKSVLVSTVITKLNKDTILDLLNYLNQYNETYNNLNSWNLYRLLPTGRGGEKNIDRLQIPEEEFKQIVSHLKTFQRNFKITVRNNMYSSQRVDFYYSVNGKTTLMQKYFKK